MDDTIYRQAAIDSIEFGITHAKAINTETGEVVELFKTSNAELRKAVERVKELPSAQPEIIRCKDCAKRECCRTSTVWAIPPKDDWYCGDAERRNDE